METSLSPFCCCLTSNIDSLFMYDKKLQCSSAMCPSAAEAQAPAVTATCCPQSFGQYDVTQSGEPCSDTLIVFPLVPFFWPTEGKVFAQPLPSAHFCRNTDTQPPPVRWQITLANHGGNKTNYFLGGSQSFSSRLRQRQITPT